MRKSLLVLSVISSVGLSASPIQAAPGEFDFVFSAARQHWCAKTPYPNDPNDPQWPTGHSLYAVIAPSTTGSFPIPTITVTGTSGNFTTSFGWTGGLGADNSTAAGNKLDLFVQFWVASSCDVIGNFSLDPYPFKRALAPALSDPVCQTFEIAGTQVNGLDTSDVSIEIVEELQDNLPIASDWDVKVMLPTGTSISGPVTIDVGVNTCLGPEDTENENPGNEDSDFRFPIDADFLNRETPGALPDTK